ncbi:GNAT family N-acetyltransferase [Deinococcus sp. Marseille-Q6407]|uniref:GNAT family N-acetyltransferase n=1 Tax=Deinococcus sp. Marseille-Q6407 TaxID=2969223 RepID=UPI0021C2013A|nr:GNAT family N-acetyltransferase [Deinococcus sp. Marseille-Q6407]
MTETPRLFLLPLSRELMLQTIGAAQFRAQGFFFPEGWAGEAAIVFPIHLLNLGEEDAVRGSFALIERDSGRAIGLLGTKHAPRQGRVEIGYGLTPGARGRGYATEAVGALLDELRRWPDVQTVLAETLPHNHASIRVLEKNGFSLTGRRHDASDGELLCWAASVRAGSH